VFLLFRDVSPFARLSLGTRACSSNGKTARYYRENPPKDLLNFVVVLSIAALVHRKKATNGLRLNLSQRMCSINKWSSVRRRNQEEIAPTKKLVATAKRAEGDESSRRVIELSNMASEVQDGLKYKQLVVIRLLPATPLIE
jgi:hypothetical protein